MSARHALRQLRALLLASAAPHDERWQKRFDDLPRIVRDAEEKFGGAKPNPKTGSSWRWIWDGEVQVEDSRKWLVADLLPEVAVALISGQWGAFKTFIAIDLACAVMTAGKFIRFPVVRQGGVLLFACEGQNEVTIRLRAGFESRRGQGKAPFAWQENAPRLLNDGATEILVAMIKEAADKMQCEFGLPVALVIIDTAGRAAGYRKAGDENDSALGQNICCARGAYLERRRRVLQQNLPDHVLCVTVLEELATESDNPR
jgi:hypothetical protein